MHRIYKAFEADLYNADYRGADVRQVGMWFDVCAPARRLMNRWIGIATGVCHRISWWCGEGQRQDLISERQRHTLPLTVLFLGLGEIARVSTVASAYSLARGAPPTLWPGLVTFDASQLASRTAVTTMSRIHHSFRLAHVC